MTNDLFANALLAAIDTDGGTYLSGQIPNTGFTREPGEPGTGYRTAWWSYTPLAAGSLVVDTHSSPGSPDTILAIYTGSSVNALTLIASDDDYSGLLTSQVAVSVTAGVTYSIQVSAYSDLDMTYVLRAAGPQTRGVILGVPFAVTVKVPDQINSPPIGVGANVGGADALEVPAVGVAASPPKVAFPVKAAPIGAAATVRAGEQTRVARILSQPADGATVPLLRPSLVVSVSVREGTPDDIAVQVQYGPAAAFPAGAAILAQALDPVIGENVVTFTVPDDILTPQQWRARLVLGGQAMAWAPSRAFTADPAAGEHSASLTWAVTTGPADPHLWYVTPAAGVPGDLVTIVGQGFSASRGTVQLDGVPMPVQRWANVPERDTGIGLQVIDPANGQVDPEHDEVIVTVPDAHAPGGPIVVIDGDGTIPADPSPPREVAAPPLAPVGVLVSPATVPPRGVAAPPVALGLLVGTADPVRLPPLAPGDGIATAIAVAVGASGTVIASPISNIGLTAGDDEASLSPAPPAGYRSAWWKLNVGFAHGLDLTVDASGSTTPVHIALYSDFRANGGGISESGRAPGGANPNPVLSASFYFMYPAVSTFLVRVSADADVDATHNLTITATLTP